MYKILLIAAEKSADQLAAALIRELKNKTKIHLYGIGGEHLQNQGMKLLFHMDQMAFMGAIEILRRLPFIRKVKKKILQSLPVEQPDLAILVDYAGFNLRLAKHLHQRGIPVIYYISPKIWAWGRGRIKKIQKYVDRMIVLFPFEEKFYQDYHVPVSFAGHPMVDQLQSVSPELSKSSRCLGILPGSRRQEVLALLADMLETARILHKQGLISSAEILKVSGLPLKIYESHLHNDDQFIQIVEKPMAEALPGYSAAIVASGTATLETGYFGVPMVIVYRVNRLTYHLARWLVKLTHVGLVNIVAEKEVAKELIQNDFTIDAAVKELKYLLDSKNQPEVRNGLSIVRQKLGPAGASERAARTVLGFLESADGVN